MTPKCFPLKQLTHYLTNFCDPGVVKFVGKSSPPWASHVTVKAVGKAVGNTVGKVLSGAVISAEGYPGEHLL